MAGEEPRRNTDCVLEEDDLPDEEFAEEGSMRTDLSKVGVIAERVTADERSVYGCTGDTCKKTYEWHQEYLERVCGEDFRNRHRTKNKGERSCKTRGELGKARV